MLPPKIEAWLEDYMGVNTCSHCGKPVKVGKKNEDGVFLCYECERQRDIDFLKIILAALAILGLFVLAVFGTVVLVAKL